MALEISVQLQLDEFIINLLLSSVTLSQFIDHHYGGIALDNSIEFCKGGIRHKFAMSATLSSTQIQSKVANIHGNKIFSNPEEMLISNIWKLFFRKFLFEMKGKFHMECETV